MIYHNYIFATGEALSNDELKEIVVTKAGHLFSVYPDIYRSRALIVKEDGYSPETWKSVVSPLVYVTGEDPKGQVHEMVASEPHATFAWAKDKGWIDIAITLSTDHILLEDRPDAIMNSVATIQRLGRQVQADPSLFFSFAYRIRPIYVLPLFWDEKKGRVRAAETVQEMNMVLRVRFPDDEIPDEERKAWGDACIDRLNRIAPHYKNLSWWGHQL